MDCIQEVTSDIVQEWLNGTLTTQRSFEARKDIEMIINEAEKSASPRWNYFKIAEVGDTWIELTGNGLLKEITPYAQGKVLYLTLRLLEGQQISLEIAHKMILHVWN